MLMYRVATRMSLKHVIFSPCTVKSTQQCNFRIFNYVLNRGEFLMSMDLQLITITGKSVNELR